MVLPLLRRILLWAYLAVVAVGLVAFLSTKAPDPFTPALAEPPSIESQDGRVNWAAVHSGGRVRASIYDHFRSHHPMYLIDGEPDPTETEKWASLASEPTPWVEIALDRPHDIDEVVVYHAGWRERPEFTNDRYSIRCFGQGAPLAELGIIDNGEPIAHHPLACPGADRIWLGFDCSNGLPDVTRIYEIQAWGAP